MKKEEIIHLHILLCEMKKYCEEHGIYCDFSKYLDLRISPLQLYRSKAEHKQAIFMLALALLTATNKKSGTA
jgi:hypothetical protein